MSSFTHNCSGIDSELTTRGDRSRRLRRVLGVLVVAVALPAAFATSQAAASTDEALSKNAPVTAPIEQDTSACDALLETPKVGETCGMTSDKDLSGKTVGREVPQSRTDSSGDSLKQQAGVIIVVFNYDCYHVGTITWPGGSVEVWWCELTTIDIYVIDFDRTAQAPTDAGKAEALEAR